MKVNTVRAIVQAVALLLVLAFSVGGGAAQNESLIQDMKNYQAETHHGDAHVERWTRALAAFGVGSHANPMTYDEAKGYSDQGWSRWTPVAGALQSLQEQSSTSQSSAPPQGQENANCAIHNLQLNLHSYSGDWILGWRRLAGEHSVEVHAKGKGLSDVWAHLEIRMTNSGLRSNAYISELIGMERKLIFLRVRAKGNGCNGGFTPWEHIQTRY